VNDAPDHALHPATGRTGEEPRDQGGAVPQHVAAGSDLTRKEAKEQWLQVLEVSYLRGLLAATTATSPPWPQASTARRLIG
jgi:hypothetical protein